MNPPIIDFVFARKFVSWGFSEAAISMLKILWPLRASANIAKLAQHIVIYKLYLTPPQETKFQAKTNTLMFCWTFMAYAQPFLSGPDSL